MQEPNLEVELLAAFKDCFKAGSPEECAKRQLRKNRGLTAQEAENVLRSLKNRDWLVYGKPDSPLQHTPIHYSTAGHNALMTNRL